MTKPELENCIVEYGKDIYAFCRFLTRDRQEADELYQDTFLRAVEHSDRINIRENPKGYLLSVATRLWKDKRRKAARRNRIAPQQNFVEGWESGGSRFGEHGNPAGAENIDSPEENSEKSPERMIVHREMLEQVRREVAALPEKYRLPVILFYMEELDVTQIAEILKIPTGTVKSRLFQARKKLKEKLESVYDG